MTLHCLNSLLCVSPLMTHDITGRAETFGSRFLGGKTSLHYCFCHALAQKMTFVAGGKVKFDVRSCVPLICPCVETPGVLLGW